MKVVIGAVLAGGQSRRFGSDKALAVVHHKPLIEHCLDGLIRITPQVVVCGRQWRSALSLPDRPMAGMGPLCGLNAALHYAKSVAADWVLSVACDTPFVAHDILAALAARRSPAYVATHPVIGFWPSAAADQLDTWLAKEGNHAMRAFAQEIDASPWDVHVDIANFNYASELAAWSAHEDGQTE